MNGSAKKSEEKNTWQMKMKKKTNTGPKSLGCSKTYSKGKYVAIQAYIKKQKVSNNLTLHLQKLGKEELWQTKQNE